MGGVLVLDRAECNSALDTSLVSNVVFNTSSSSLLVRQVKSCPLILRTISIIDNKQWRFHC